MLDPLPIQPLDHPPDAAIPVPGSKSITNRALLIAAMAEGESTLTGALFSDDTARMQDCLRACGAAIEEDQRAERFNITGLGGPPRVPEATLFTGNSGTTARFIAPFAAAGRGYFVIDGVPRMRQRPMGALIRSLRSLGVQIQSREDNDCPPLEIDAQGVEGGHLVVSGSETSQHISGLLMCAPLFPRGLDLIIEGDPVSRPYIELTAAVMEAFGVRVDGVPGGAELRVPAGQKYRGREYHVEPDASNASYFFAAAALTGGRIRVEGLGCRSRQGDLALLNVIRSMGCEVTQGEEWTEVRGPDRLPPFDVDAADFSDMAQTLYALAPFTGGECRVRGVEHSRLQECDRVAASATELRRLGQEVVELPDGLIIRPRAIQPGVIATYDDHRMAMAFALIGLRSPGIAISDPGCTAKTFPGYWDALELLRNAPRRAVR